MNRRTVLVFAFAVLFLTLPASRAQATAPGLSKVHRIHVATLGSGPEADRFHSLLEDELRGAGFEIAAQASDADAVLSGEFSSGATAEKSFARATVKLKSPDGKRILWSGDYYADHRGQGLEDVLKTDAENCAEHLRKDWEKAGGSAN